MTAILQLNIFSQEGTSSNDMSIQSIKYLLESKF